MELLDLYNNKREKIGEVFERVKGLEPDDGKYKLNVHVYIFNSENKLLIQKRASNLSRYPGMWNFTGGAVDAGETSYEGARRELLEELDISVDIEYMLSFKREHDFVDVWIGKVDIKEEDVNFDNSEVSEVKWVTLEELEDLINNDLFVPSIKLYYDLFKKLLYKCYMKI